jgi:hypothetical protein
MGQGAMQQKNASAFRGVYMSLLRDQSFILHPEQIRRIQNRLHACTVGNIRKKLIIKQPLNNI